MVGPKEPSDGRIHPIPNSPPVLSLQKLAQTMMVTIDSRPVAKEAIRSLGLKGMSPDELLDNLTVEQVETSQVIRLTYADTDPERAKEVANTVGRVASERVSKTRVASNNNLDAIVYERARAPKAPVSPKPLRNGLIALVVGLVLSAGLIAVRERLRRN